MERMNVVAATGQSNKIDKSNVEDIVSLTPTQEGMLFHYVRQENRSFYVQQLVLTLTGQIAVDHMRSAWDAVISRNEMLRTLYRWDKLESPIQVVLKHKPAVLHVYDGTTLAEDELLARRAELSCTEQLAITLEEQPFRIALLLIQADQCEMIISWHHILYDGWSNGVVLKEWMEEYERLATQSMSSGETPPQKTKFKELVKWLKNQDADKQRRYWNDLLSGVEAGKSLPLANEAFIAQRAASSVKHVTVNLSGIESDEVSAFVRQHGITLASLLYSAWGSVLQKYLQSSDIVIGTTVSGRVPELDGVEDMVGLFINTIPLRITMKEEEPALELVNRIHEQCTRREEFEHTPLIDIGTYSGLSGAESLFNTIVVLENYPLDERIRSNRILKIDSYHMHEMTHYDVTLGVMTMDIIEFDLSFDPQRISMDMMVRMAGHLKTMLLGIIRDAQQPVCQLAMLTEEEWSVITTCFNKPAAAQDAVEPVHRLFERQAAVFGDQPAIVHRGNSINYKQVNEQANRLAKRLIEQGLLSEQPVAILLERSACTIIAMLGVLKAGGVYIPIDDQYSEERIQYMLQDSHARVLITSEEWQCRISFNGAILQMEPGLETAESDCVEQRDFENLPQHVEAQQAAYIIYTSGSTGKPKGVIVEHRQLLAYTAAFQQEFQLTSADRFLQQSSCSFDQFVEEVYPVLLVGGTVIVADKQDVLDLERLAQLTRDHNVSIVSCSPLLLNEINKRHGLPNVHTYISGGDVLKPEYIRQLVQVGRVYNTYGPTEATVCAAYHRCTGSEQQDVPIGRPIFNYNVYIMDDYLQLLPIGVVGEICIAGHGVARGYMNRSELTAEKFVLDPVHRQSLMYRTGDLGKWLPDGSIHYVGRSDEQVKIRGYRVELGEIEHHLRNHTAVQEAIVLAVDDGYGSKMLAAYIQLIDDSETERAGLTLREYAADKLPAYMVPAVMYRMDAVPLTINGKVDKKALQAINQRLHDPLEDGDQTDLTSTEALILEAWQDVLRREHIGRHEPFFEAGGNSILLMQLHTKLEKKYNWGTTVTDLFTHTTIAKLAKYVDLKHAQASEVPQIAYQRLPAEYFSHQPLAGGSMSIKCQLEHGTVTSLRQMALDHETELVDLLLSMYAYLLTQINGSTESTIQLMDEDGQQVIPLAINLSELQGFAQLFSIVHTTRSEPQVRYSINTAPRMLVHKSKGSEEILSLAAYNTEVSQRGEWLRTYDLMLLLDEEEVGSGLTASFRFNDKRLKKEKISALLQAYQDMLHQLSERYART
ncbi:amino acid adenylation domain-containing protein [Paenibacillus sp. ACRRX]|uniref:non-ribosomal peptide synthetase n=1 Tax=Paenibacillus sp. ACRRX TaxID=2918206 RepID=UPI001EF542DB|nr:amino acid adenylation domain-containing protein [Paenibacillus sp. ACRRX]MCG7407271.1 amino acid adenylation domain-containing protein [Paenibacillus sp. ACRRX]